MLEEVLSLWSMCVSLSNHLYEQRLAATKNPLHFSSCVF